MLKCVVQHDDIDAFGQRFPHSAQAIGGLDYRDTAVEALVNESLITTVPAQNDRRGESTLQKLSRQPRGHGSFASSADSQIPDAHDGNRHGTCFQYSVVIQKGAAHHRRPVNRLCRR
jgi:hypothetical protein